MTRDNELAATHTSGKKLYVPLCNMRTGDVIPSALPLAAISIDKEGKTYPEGSFWLRNELNHIKEGWTLAKPFQNTPQTHANSGVKSQKRPTAAKLRRCNG